MDAMPGYTMFNPTKKVLCAIQIVEDAFTKTSAQASVFSHDAENAHNFGLDEKDAGWADSFTKA